MRKLGFAFGILYSGLAFAHVKPFGHIHIGHLHPEDILAGLVALGIFLTLIPKVRRRVFSFARRG
ncbi:MAG: hypothetical protein GXO18_06665 [Aquificae bacterium]|nr:hypothetical protein [Aquificota bacterium]